MTPSSRAKLPRRAVLGAASWGGLLSARLGLAAAWSFGARSASGAADDTRTDDSELIQGLTGRTARASTLVRLDMPPVFGNGYSVPLTLTVDSPMTEADHVRLVQVVAPRNPIVVAAQFHFTPRSGRVAISTRIRLAGPQGVLALAEMSDGTLLVARTWVKVDTDGCA